LGGCNPSNTPPLYFDYVSPIINDHFGKWVRKQPVVGPQNGNYKYSLGENRKTEDLGLLAWSDPLFFW